MREIALCRNVRLQVVGVDRGSFFHASLVGFGDRVAAFVAETAIADLEVDLDPQSRAGLVRIGDYHAAQHRAPIRGAHRSARIDVVPERADPAGCIFVGRS